MTPAAARSLRVPHEPAATRCSRCGREYTESGWEVLAVVLVIEPMALRELVTPWPRDHAIEVRRCAHCPKAIARRVKMPARHAVR